MPNYVRNTEIYAGILCVCITRMLCGIMYRCLIQNLYILPVKVFTDFTASVRKHRRDLADENQFFHSVESLPFQIQQIIIDCELDLNAECLYAYLEPSSPFPICQSAMLL